MNDEGLRRIVQERLQAVEERLTAACRRAGRSRSDVTLVAVTKTISAELAARLPEWGITQLGENRVQELVRKVDHLRSLNDDEGRPLAPAVRWHMVGHLQRNKIEQVLPLVDLVHAVDSVRLLQAIDQEAVRKDLHPTVLVQVNTSGEESKHGFRPSDVAELAPAIKNLKRVQVHGLMTMAAFEEPEACRPRFVRLRGLGVELGQMLGRPLEALSMGMTNDFEIAVEEGATLVRLGTVLFAGLEKEPT